jgi:hypothetical protein
MDHAMLWQSLSAQLDFVNACAFIYKRKSPTISDRAISFARGYMPRCLCSYGLGDAFAAGDAVNFPGDVAGFIRREQHVDRR